MTCEQFSVSQFGYETCVDPTRVAVIPLFSGSACITLGATGYGTNQYTAVFELEKCAGQKVARLNKGMVVMQKYATDDCSDAAVSTTSLQCGSCVDWASVSDLWTCPECETMSASGVLECPSLPAVPLAEAVAVPRETAATHAQIRHHAADDGEMEAGLPLDADGAAFLQAPLATVEL